MVSSLTEIVTAVDGVPSPAVSNFAGRMRRSAMVNSWVTFQTFCWAAIYTKVKTRETIDAW